MSWYSYGYEDNDNDCKYILFLKKNKFTQKDYNIMDKIIKNHDTSDPKIEKKVDELVSDSINKAKDGTFSSVDTLLKDVFHG